MFIRRKRIGEARTKVQTVRSERIGNWVRQKVLRHVGTAVRGPADERQQDRQGDGRWFTGGPADTGAHRCQLDGRLLPAASASPPGGARPSDEPGPYPAGPERAPVQHTQRKGRRWKVRPAARRAARRQRDLPDAGAEMDSPAVRV